MTGGFVIIAAHLVISVPVLNAKELIAPAPKSSQPYLPLATEAPVHLSLHLWYEFKIEPLQSNPIRCRGRRRQNVLARHLRSSRSKRTRTRSMMNLQQLVRWRRGHCCYGHHRCWWWRICCCYCCVWVCGGCCWWIRGVEVVLAHVVGGRITSETVVVDTKKDFLVYLELGLFFFNFLSHDVLDRNELWGFRRRERSLIFFFFFSFLLQSFVQK